MEATENFLQAIVDKLSMIEKITLIRQLRLGNDSIDLMNLFRDNLPEIFYAERTKLYDDFFALLLRDAIEPLCDSYMEQFYAKQSDYTGDLVMIGHTVDAQS